MYVMYVIKKFFENLKLKERENVGNCDKRVVW